CRRPAPSSPKASIPEPRFERSSSTAWCTRARTRTSCASSSRRRPSCRRTWPDRSWPCAVSTRTSSSRPSTPCGPARLAPKPSTAASTCTPPSAPPTGSTSGTARPDHTRPPNWAPRSPTCCWPLSTGERGLPRAVLEEALHADLAVLRLEHLDEEVPFTIEPRLQRQRQALVDRPLRPRLGLKGAVGHLGGKGERPLVELIGRHHFVGQADTQR